MHDALLIGKVLDRIIDYLAEDTIRHPTSFYARDTQKGGRCALAVLARTCRAFSEPALDALWRRLHSLEPIMLCLLGDLYGCDDDPVASYSFSDKEWDIVLRHTPRVQELAIPDEVSVGILQLLIFRITLPNLQRLEWSHEDYTMMASIRPLLSPSLLHLRIQFAEGDHCSVSGLLQSYHLHCPNLKSVYFYHSSRFPSVTAAISRSICRLPALERISCGSIDEAALTHASQSRFLKSFSASLHGCPLDALTKIASLGTSAQRPFENLRVLDLRVANLFDIIPFLRSRGQAFTSVSIGTSAILTPDVLHDFLIALSSPPRRSSLQRIRLCTLGIKTRGPKPVTFQVLSPLLSFNHLFHVDIDLANCIFMDDEELAQLARAWPELETFILNNRNGWDVEPSQLPTLNGFLALLAHCPNLRDLALCVDARNVPSSPAVEPTGEKKHNAALTTLSLVDSPIQEPISKVTEFLMEHVPSVTSLPVWRAHDHYSPGGKVYGTLYKSLWIKVSEQIQEMKGGD